MLYSRRRSICQTDCGRAYSEKSNLHLGPRTDHGGRNSFAPFGLGEVARWPKFLKDAKLDRKSTRLNSSHGYISYAVFCLKKHNDLRDSFRDIGRMLLAAEGRKPHDSPADCYQYSSVSANGPPSGLLHILAGHYSRTLPLA